MFLMDLFTWQSLATLASASLLVYYFTQYTKNLLDKLFHIPTDLYGTIVGALVLALAQFAMGASFADWKIWVLSFFNGFLVQAVAGKMNDSAIKYNSSGNTTDTTK
jgi:hypothetical protein